MIDLVVWCIYIVLLIDDDGSELIVVYVIWYDYLVFVVGLIINDFGMLGVV